MSHHLDLGNPTDEQRLCVELYERLQCEVAALRSELRIAKAIAEDAKAHGQRLLEENRELRRELDRG